MNNTQSKTVYEIAKQAVDTRRDELRTIYRAIGREITAEFKKHDIPLIDPCEDGKGHTDSAEWILATTMASQLTDPFLDIMWWGIGEPKEHLDD